MTRRLWLALCTLLCLGGAAPVRAQAYLDDPRTARAVFLTTPRVPLGEALRALSGTSGVSLSAAPGLAEEAVVAGIPSRPLRETMGALAELFEGTWARVPGTPPAYRLDPDAARVKAREAARKRAITQHRHVLDALAAEALKAYEPGEPGAGGSLQQRELLFLMFWVRLSPADRERVLRGETVTHSIPPAEAKREYELVLRFSSRETAPLVAPLIGTIDTQDWADTGHPQLHLHVTALREDSLIYTSVAPDRSRFSPKRPPAPPMAPGDVEGPELPVEVGDGGRFNGDRDELIAELALGAGVPVLSRHRSCGGTVNIEASRKKVGEVARSLASACEATATLTARGYYLFRSRTETTDPAGKSSAAVVEDYLSRRPRTGEPVGLRKLMPLASLTPLQLSVLRRSNMCSNEADAALEAYALLRFCQSLTPQQQEALFGPDGVELTTLSALQLHALLDERERRASFDIMDELQHIKGLRLRFRDQPPGEEGSAVLEAVRKNEVAVSKELELPVVEPEEAPTTTPPVIKKR